MAPIKNRTSFSEFQQRKEFPMTNGIHEGHVFLTPLNPTSEQIRQYEEAVQKFNNEKKPNSLMKACLLALRFRNHKDDDGFITVMQSARYTTGGIEHCYTELQSDADFLAQNLSEEFTVIREKLECIASADGVPKTCEEAMKYPECYFEHHVKVQKKVDPQLLATKEELDLLVNISDDIQTQLGIPVPFSHNKRNECQRFLNERHRKCGSIESYRLINCLVDSINKSEVFEKSKVISEYVPLDTFTDLDKGWIDF
jgi:hypothetical protein